jgi:hypothetical protein
MKKVMIFCAALLLAQCTPSAKDELGTLITDYQSFKAFDYDEFPLGDYSEQRFEKQYSFYQDCFNRAQEINTSELSDDELHCIYCDLYWSTESRVMNLRCITIPSYPMLVFTIA